MSKSRALLAFPSALLPALLALSLAAPAAAQVASLARDINPGPVDLSPGDLGGSSSWLVTAGSRVYFPDRTDASGTELWTSDGTAFGTAQVADLCPGPCSGQPAPVGVLGDVFLFTAEGPRRLWRTDGTPAGTYRLSAEGADEQPPALLGGKIVFVLCPSFAPGCELWSTDGTLAGTGKLGAVGGQVLALATAGRQVFALCTTAAGGLALWASDGIGGTGTRLVAPVAADLQFLLPAGDRVVLWGSAGETSEIWGSDGTPAGTGLLERFGPDPGADQGSFFATSLGGKVYFAAAGQDGSGLQLWASDGNVSSVGNGGNGGTVRVTGLQGFTPYLPDPSYALLLGGRLLFTAVDAGGKARLFATAGTPASTVQLSPAAVPSRLAGVGTRALFLADDGVHGTEPWTSDGTPAGTRLVADTCPGACGVPGIPLLLPLAPLGGAAIFLSGDPATGADLWTSDGTPAGTRRYTDFGNLGSSRPLVSLPITAIGGASGSRIFFAATDPVHGTELWTSDGRSGGTRRVTDIGRRAPSSDPAELTALNTAGIAGNAASGRVLFTACDGVNRGVWSSDGSPVGTVAVFPPPGAASPCADTANRPRSLNPAAGGVYFLAGSGPGLTLWRADGNSSGAARCGPRLHLPGGAAVRSAALGHRHRDLVRRRDRRQHPDLPGHPGRPDRPAAGLHGDRGAPGPPLARRPRQPGLLRRRLRRSVRHLRHRRRRDPPARRADQRLPRGLRRRLVPPAERQRRLRRHRHLGRPEPGDLDLDHRRHPGRHPAPPPLRRRRRAPPAGGVPGRALVPRSPHHGERAERRDDRALAHRRYPGRHLPGRHLPGGGGERPGGRRRPALLHRRRPGPRPRALGERRRRRERAGARHRRRPRGQPARSPDLLWFWFWRRRQPALLHRRRRGARGRALDERRHRPGHPSGRRPGAGRQLVQPRLAHRRRRPALLRRRRRPLRPRAVERPPRRPRLRARGHPALPRRRPLPGGDRLAGLRGPYRGGPHAPLDRRHRGFLVLRPGERRGDRQGARRPRS